MDDWAFLLERTLQSWRAAGKPRRVVAAVSGGADSVALLLVLAQIARQEGIHLSCAHVDHGLRREAAADADFVARLCEKNGVPCRIFRLSLAGRSEDEARRARYDAILKGFEKEPDFFLALAHHQRDQAETMLLHLFRGGGGRGLSGMAACSARPRPGGRVVLWRPFLDISPDVIRRMLQVQGVSWREDATNAQDDYLRNYIRHQVLPVVRARIPEAEAAMGRAANILAQEEDCFQQEARAFLKEHACLRDPFCWIAYSPFAALHPAKRRHVLRLASPVLLDWAQTEALGSLCAGKTVNLPSGWRAQRIGDRLHFLPPADFAGAEELPRSAGLSVSPFIRETGDGKRTQAIPRAVYAACVLRTWQPGDRIRPLGAKGGKSLQDYFMDKKVPRPFRSHIPLLCSGQQVVWAIGIGPGEEARVSPGDDAVLLTYDGFLPGDVTG